MLTGASKRHDAMREVALYAAWHVAVWHVSAKVGKLKDWAQYRRTLFGSTDSTPTPAKDWKERKAERLNQMQDLRKHQQARKRPVRRGHG